MFSSRVLFVRAGGVNSGMHSVRPSHLPYKPWGYDTRFMGKTALEVMDKYKLKTFPRYSFPPSLLYRKVEEIDAMAREMKSKEAQEAMRLLTLEGYDKDSFQVL